MMNNDLSLPKVVFILGVMPRSGSHFLGNLLCQHPDCFKSVIPEDCLMTSAQYLTGYVNRSFWLWEREGELPELPLRKMMLRNLGNGLKNFLLEVREESRKKHSLEDTANAKSRNTQQYLITKTPQVVNIDKFFQIFPDEKLIIIARDGRAVVESNLLSFNYKTEEAIRDWMIAVNRVKQFESFQKNSPKKYLVVKYEDLHSNTKDEIGKVLQFLKLDEEKFDFETALNIPVVGSSVFKRGTGPVHWAPVKKTEEFKPLERAANWTRAQHERFNWLAKDGLLYWGYEPKTFEGQKTYWKFWNHLLDFKYGIRAWYLRFYNLLSYIGNKLKKHLKGAK